MAKYSPWIKNDRYGTYTGPKGDPEQWRSSFKQRMTQPEAQQIIGDDSPWSVLGLPVGASMDEIKSAWRKWSLQWHPDRPQHKTEAEKEYAQKMFIKGQAAYTLLKGE